MREKRKTEFDVQLACLVTFHMLRICFAVPYNWVPEQFAIAYDKPRPLRPVATPTGAAFSNGQNFLRASK